MQKSFRLPVIRCDQCDDELEISIQTGMPPVIIINCVSCDYKLDLNTELKGQTVRSMERMKKISKEAANAIENARKEMPSNMDELKEAIKDPKHPFTAAVLAGLVLVAMEFSGFGIFAALTWILGNLILNPISWVLIPVVVAIVFTYRKRIKSDRLEDLRKKLKDLDRQLEDGEITKEEHKDRKDESVKGIFD